MVPPEARTQSARTRWVEPSAIASMALYLCSDMGAGITGASIPVDLGGSEKFGL